MKNSPAVQRFGPVLFVTVLFGLAYLQVNTIIGPLAMDLPYDDVVYAIDGAQRLEVIQRQGLAAFLKGLWQSPPHSPFATLLAMAAFLMGGLHEFALYASNIVVLVGMAVFVVHELRREHTPAQVLWGGLLFLLVSPLASKVMNEFRPDLALGLATAMMVVWFVRGLVSGSSDVVRLAGLMLGVALLIKPTFFAHTLAMAGGLLAVAVFNGVVKGRWSWALPGVHLRDGAVFLTIGVGVAMPYFLAHGASIARYFYSNTRGDQSAIWSIAESEPLWVVLRTMLQYVYSLSGMHVALALVVGVAAAVFLAIKRHRSAVATWLLLLCFGLASFSVMVLGRHRNGYFLATFTWLALLGGVFVAAEAYKKLDHPWRQWSTALVAAATLIVVLDNSRTLVRQNDWQGLRADSLNVSLVRTVLHDYAQSRGREAVPSVYVPFAGIVNADAMRWTTLKFRREANFIPGYMATDLAALQVGALSADYVVLPNDLIARYAPYLPSTPALPALLEWVSAHPEFSPVSALDSGTPYFVFRNVRSLQANTPPVRVEGGLAVIDGFHEEEGPYPDRNLPRVRWMVKQDARVCVIGDSGGRYDVSVSMLGSGAGSLEVRGDGKEDVLASHAVSAALPMASFSFVWVGDVRRSCLRFRLVPDKPLAGDLLVLFSRLHVIRKPPATN